MSTPGIAMQYAKLGEVIAMAPTPELVSALQMQIAELKVHLAIEHTLRVAAESELSWMRHDVKAVGDELRKLSGMVIQ